MALFASAVTCIVHFAGAQQPNVVYVQGHPQHKTVYVQDKGKSKGTGKMLAGTHFFRLVLTK